MDELLEKENQIQDEIEFNKLPGYQLGSYLYMGMAYKNEKKVCISVGYTLSYSIKKVDEFLSTDPELAFSHISKIITGKKIACKKFYPGKPLNQYYK